MKWKVLAEKWKNEQKFPRPLFLDISNPLTQQSQMLKIILILVRSFFEMIAYKLIYNHLHHYKRQALLKRN